MECRSTYQYKCLDDGDRISIRRRGRCSTFSWRLRWSSDELVFEPRVFYVRLYRALDRVVELGVELREVTAGGELLGVLAFFVSRMFGLKHFLDS